MTSLGPTLPSVCYGIAYTLLPHYAFTDCDNLAKMFIVTPKQPGIFFYFIGCQMCKAEPIPEVALRFKAHYGKLNEMYYYFVLEYPKPPPLDISGNVPPQMAPELSLLVAPYFSAVVRNCQTKEVNYYTLGRSPVNGITTLRSVTPDKVNRNLGFGPEPELDSFLNQLRSRH